MLMCLRAAEVHHSPDLRRALGDDQSTRRKSMRRTRSAAISLKRRPVRASRLKTSAYLPAPSASRSIDPD